MIGTMLGHYQITGQLGKGGMGEVYLAEDTILDRKVAIKLLPEAVQQDPQARKRFLREAKAAAALDHPFICQIYETGEVTGKAFIVMEYVAGETLKDRMSRAPLSLTETVQTACEMAEALERAHEKGVVHRDLKPSNIMLTPQGHPKIMDFGLAKRVSPLNSADADRTETMTDELTRSNTLVGTLSYMSPEQARGDPVDARSDIFSFGVVLYEMLMGRNPFQRASPIDTLSAILGVSPPAPQVQTGATQTSLQNITGKALAKDVSERYQSMKEMSRDLQALRGELLPRKRSAWMTWALGAAGLAVISLVVVTWWFAHRGPAPPPLAHPPVSVLIADFENQTSDPVFNGTLEPVLNVAIEGAPFITAYRHSQARRIAEQLQPGVTRLDESIARLVARREGIDVILAGSISSQGKLYGISINAVDAATGKLISAREARGIQKDSVMKAVGKLAIPIRRALGDTTPESTQIAAAETFTAANLDAANLYSLGQELAEQGKSGDAIRYYQSAIQLDPKFARAYAGLAVAFLNLKRQEQAGEYYKKALAMLDRMSDRERLRTLGAYYSAFLHNYPQGIETYRKLVSLYPGDGVGWNNLSIGLVFTLNIPEALAASRRALELSPKSLQYRLNFALYSMYAGEFQNAITEAQRVLKENPAYEFAYLPLALSTLSNGDVQGARVVYAKLETVSPYGFSMAKMGQADLEMYLGRNKEALEPLAAGIAADMKQKSTGELALKYVGKAEAHIALGQTTQAVELAEKAAELSKADNVLLPAARVFIQAGRHEEARQVAAELESMLQTQTRSYAKLIAGEIDLQEKRLPQAVAALHEAQKLHNSWLSHFLLGRAYLEAGHFAEALAEFEICRERRGESTDILFADTTTLRYLPPLYYWLARAQEGTGMTQAARETYREFLKLRTNANPRAPMVGDAERRSGM